MRPKSTRAKSMFWDIKTDGKAKGGATHAVIDITNPLIHLNSKRRAIPADRNVFRDGHFKL